MNKETFVPKRGSLRIGISRKHLFLVIASLYLFVSSIVLIKESTILMGQEQVQNVLGSIRSTTTGVFAGLFGTALIQSSGAFDSIIIAFVSAGVVPTYVAVATIIGAEVGTTITTQLVSVLGYLTKDREKFKSSFLVAMMHYWYNLGVLLIFFPIELFFGSFTYIAQIGSSFFSKVPGLSAVPTIFALITPWVELLLFYIPAWIGFIGGCTLLILSLRNCEKYLSATFATGVSRSLIQSTFGSPYRAFFAGMGFTIIVPSTSVMVSILIPLATTGIIDSDYHILPYILGANIGTVFDVMIAALATGDPTAIGVWLVHLTINIIGACIFLPLLKPFNTFIEIITDFLTFSRKRILVFVSLSNIIPLLILILSWVI